MENEVQTVMVICVRHGHRLGPNGEKLPNLTPKGIEEVRWFASTWAVPIVSEYPLVDVVHTCTERTEETGRVFAGELGVSHLVRPDERFKVGEAIFGPACEIYGSYEDAEDVLNERHPRKPAPIREYLELFPPTHGSLGQYRLAMRQLVEENATRNPHMPALSIGLAGHGGTSEMLAADVPAGLEMPYVREFAGGVLYEWHVKNGRATLVGAERLHGLGYVE